MTWRVRGLGGWEGLVGERRKRITVEGSCRGAEERERERERERE